MKKLFFSLLIVFAVCSSPKLYSQVIIKWNQSDGQNLFYDCKDSLAKSGLNLKDEQIEKICYCYKDAIVKKYLREDYQKLSSEELKNIKDATITECLKNSGIGNKKENKESSKPKPKNK